MSLDSLIAIAGLLLAVYQIAPRSRQLDIQVRLRTLDWALLCGGFLGVLYCQFYPTFLTLDWTPHLGLGKWGISPERASFLIVGAISVAVYVHLRFARLGHGQIDKFRRLVEELIWSSNYPELFALLSRHLPRLRRIAVGDFWSTRVRRRLLKHDPERHRLPEELRKNPPPELLEALSKLPPSTRGQRLWNRVKRIFDRLVYSIAFLIPDRTRPERVGWSVLHNLLVSKEFASAIAKLRPDFALTILSLQIQSVFEFFDNLMRALLSDPSSVLFSEVRNNQNVSSNHLYPVPETNRLLYYLFHDANVARQLSAWGAVGNEMVRILDDLKRKTDEDPYNLVPDQDFQERARWESPLFVGVSYVDIMVSNALHQGVEYHMWLFYFPLLTERIVRNYSPRDPLFEAGVEWETRYNFLLYLISPQ